MRLVVFVEEKVSAFIMVIQYFQGSNQGNILPAVPGYPFDPSTMIKDNDWIIEYDMEIAGVFAHKMRARKEELAPDFIFDNGYASWNGYTPNDIKAAAKEKMAMLELARTDKRRYMTEIKSWTENRLKRLADEGWRKAKRYWQQHNYSKRINCHCERSEAI